MAESTAKCEISQEHLECPICLRRFNDPKILDCLHSYCRNCLEDLVGKHQPDAHQIICPVCRKATEIPDSRLGNLKSCFFLTSLVDDVNEREIDNLLGEASASNLICEECEYGLEAVSRCLDYNANICQQCRAAHERLKHLKKHRIVSDLSPSHDVTAKDIGSPKCTQHPDYNLYFYCETCKILICAMCAACDHRTAEHTFSTIPDAISFHRKDVDDVLKKFRKSEEEFQASQESISHSQKRLKLMVTKACDDVSAKEKEEIAKIKTKAGLLRDEITNIGKDRDKEYKKVFNSNRDKMGRANTIVTAVSDLMEHADDFEVLELRPKVMHNLEFQEELFFEHVEHRMSFIGVKCHDVVSDIDLGKILQEEKWLLKNTFVGDETEESEFSAHDVVALKNGDIVVTNRITPMVSVFTSNGHFKTSLNPESGLAAPHSVAVKRNGLLLVTDGDLVKVFNTNQQLIRQFKPAQHESGEVRESNLTCIAVDEQNRVAVADTERNVYVTNMDGLLISIIPTSRCPADIAFQNDDRLILSNYDISRLLCVDLSGREIFNITTESNGQLVRPRGVCCDDAGDIYVNVDLGGNVAGKGELHRYTVRGVHVQCIAQGLCWPWGMAFSSHGELVVADYDSVKIFHRA